jgi:UDP:flavonoid glycosyltransferase YjiC (YdhE family)
MRVLFSSFSGSGHFHPLVPSARALQAAGHEVAFAVPASFVANVEANGFKAFAAGFFFDTMNMDLEQMRKQQAVLMAGPPEKQAEFAASMFVDTFARGKVPELLRACEEWKPELLVFDSMDLSPVLVGDKLGIPYASIQVGGGQRRITDSPAVHQRMDALRSELGLSADPQGTALFRYLHLAFLPPSFFGARIAPTAHYFRPEPFDRSGTEQLPAWVESLQGKPLVYATLGTVFNKNTTSLRTIIEGLREEPVELIVTVGRDQDPAQFGALPAHVHVERYIPQSLLLPRCALAILHGGYSSVQSAVAAGVPSLIVPQGADQPMNAQAAASLGVARVLPAESLTPEFIRQQVREVLADGGYRERARKVQAEAQALPGLEHAAALLQRLGREKRPLLA